MENLLEQREEIESLKSIFPSEFAELSSSPPSFMIRLDDLDVELPSPVQLRITFTESYPTEAPRVEIPNRSNALPAEILTELLEFINSVAKEYVGMPMVFSIVGEAKDWISKNSQRIQTFHTRGAEEKTPEEEREKSNESRKPTYSVEKCLDFDFGRQQGRWEYVIGLIGKPSAGKSTFFNAATHQNLAKVAAHPFTTIEPNIGKAFYAIPCPCANMSTRCQAIFGHTANGERYVPILLKDVAGLVPGACDGRGRGNRFLNDLLDADVLIHVIDVSGETDENGKQTQGYDPTADVDWLHLELHRWIFDNIMDKWDAIRKKPAKLLNMFTGYHTAPATIQVAFAAAGINEEMLRNLWTLNHNEARKLVGALVSKFLQLRFPIFLALNKADLPDAEKNIEKFKQRFHEMSMVPVCAKAECILQQQNQTGKVEYLSGAQHFKVLPSLEETPAGCEGQGLEGVEGKVFKKYGGTGVLRALCCAVALRPPTYAFPVQCLNTCQSITAYHEKNQDTLRDCLVLKPGTTVGKLFNVMSHPPVSLLAGDYVRAECIDESGNHRVLHKDAEMNKSNQIIKIMSTKKATTSNKARN